MFRKVWIKDVARLVRFTNLKIYIKSLGNMLTIREMVELESADYIMQLKVLLFRINKRLSQQ